MELPKLDVTERLCETFVEVPELMLVPWLSVELLLVELATLALVDTPEFTELEVPSVDDVVLLVLSPAELVSLELALALLEDPFDALVPRLLLTEVPWEVLCVTPSLEFTLELFPVLEDSFCDLLVPELLLAETVLFELALVPSLVVVDSLWLV